MALDPTQLSNLLGIAASSIEDAVNQKIAESIAILENKLNKTFTTPVVLYDLKGTTAGQAVIHVNAGSQHIRLNLPALNNPEFRDHMLNVTVPHEVAHVIEYQLYGTTGHKYRWQYLMRLLDLPPDRTHDLPLPNARKTRKWAYRCDCQTHYVSTTLHNRIERGRIYTCQSCNGRLR